jgi:hypothetical protein
VHLVGSYTYNGISFIKSL